MLNFWSHWRPVSCNVEPCGCSLSASVSSKNEFQTLLYCTSNIVFHKYNVDPSSEPCDPEDTHDHTLISFKLIKLGDQSSLVGACCDSDLFHSIEIHCRASTIIFKVTVDLQGCLLKNHSYMHRLCYNHRKVRYWYLLLDTL